MQFLLNELEFNSYMLYYGDLLGDEQKAEIIRRQIEIIEHLNQLQEQGVDVFGDDDDSTITDEEADPIPRDEEDLIEEESEEIYIS